MKADNITKVDKEAASTLQLAVFKAILKQIDQDPLGVPAATLAVAERLLARYNVGLGFAVNDEREPTQEELEALDEWEKLKEESELFLDES